MTEPVTRKTLVDQVVEGLTKDIFQGQYHWGTLLPPLRSLAQQYAVTVPTAQRAIARMEEMGLVAVRHGSGMRVLNPARHANLGAFPYWIEALANSPADATKVLGDFLELRREMALIFLKKIQVHLTTKNLEGVQEKVENLATLAEQKVDLREIVSADLAIVRTLLDLQPQVAYSSIFNVFESLLLQNPTLRHAMYREPSINAVSWSLLLDALKTGSENLENIEPFMMQVDEQTLERFEEELRRTRRLQ